MSFPSNRHRRWGSPYRMIERRISAESRLQPVFKHQAGTRENSSQLLVSMKRAIYVPTVKGSTARGKGALRSKE